MTKAESFLDERLTESDASTDLASDAGVSDKEQVLATETVLYLVDWDDTILPTSWLGRQGLLNGSAASEQQLSQLTAIAEAAWATLEAAASFGKVVVVTNAGEGWVQHSCLRFLPALVPMLERLSIVSARAAFEPLGIQCPTEWKFRAFEAEMEGVTDMLADGQHFSIIAIGDSAQEHEAMLRVAQKLPGCYAKSLRFAERPTPEQLVEQHALVAGTLAEVLAHAGDLDIEVSTST